MLEPTPCAKRVSGRAIAALTVLALSGLASTQTLAETDWAALARQDLTFAAQAVAQRHPGAVLGHANVTGALDSGLRYGLADAAQARSRADYVAVMRRFIYGFGDPHTGLSVGSKVTGWNGLLVDQIDGRYRVVHAEPGRDLPAEGSEVLACDGAWVGTYLRHRVAPGVNDGMELSVTPSKLARRMMMQNELQWQPQACSFRLPDGQRREVRFSYARIPEDMAEARLDAALDRLQARATDIGVTALAPGVAWVGMPHFNVSDAEAVKAYSKMAAELKSRSRQLRWVVFDLRGNGGGASSLGQQALEALYGAPYAQQLNQMAYDGKVMVATTDLSRAIEQLLAQSPGMPDAVKAEIRGVLGQMQAAQARGERTVTVTPPQDPQARQRLRAASAKRPGGPRVAALIDRGCFSSCMAFLQMITAIDDTVVLGESTVGYSPYGEILPLALPSGQGQLSLPSAWFGSEQATQQPFEPQRRYAGRLGDTPAVQRWVLQQLQAR